MTFEVLGLSHSLSRIKDIGYINPTEIQKKSIPNILTGHDVVGSAETAPQTAGFVLLMLQLLDRPVTRLRFGKLFNSLLTEN